MADIISKYLNAAIDKVQSKIDTTLAKVIENTSPAPSSIDQFRSSLSAGLARPNQFFVNVALPSFVTTKLSATIRSLFGVSEFDTDLSLLCSEATIPAKRLNVSKININGINRTLPLNYEWDNITLTFIDTNKHLARTMFNTWMNGVSSPYSNTGKFYNDYIADIKINFLDKKNTTRDYVVMNEAFPVTINEIPLSWDSEEGYIKIAVEFAYIYQSDKDYSSSAI